MIYLDNAATSFPKPACMMTAMSECIQKYCGNPGRSGHMYSIRTAQGIYETRKELADLFGIKDSSRIIFTENATGAINLGIKGVLKKGDHVITTSMEHNSVLRPLKALEDDGVETTIISCNKDGIPDLETIKRSIKDNTKLIVCTHASNVTGTVMPVKEIGRLAGSKGILLMLDAAQSAGSRRIDVNKLGADLLAAPGHKGLLGPQGTGFLYVREGIELKPLKEGGTGTESKSRRQPADFPEGYESGTLNSPGIMGLKASIRWLKDTGIENIESHEEELIGILDEKLRNMNGITVYGPLKASEKSAITAFNIAGIGCEETAERLSKKYGIAVRAGYHCAGLAHKTIGTWDTGAVRIGVGPFNTKRDIYSAINAIYKITKEIH